MPENVSLLRNATITFLGLYHCSSGFDSSAPSPAPSPPNELYIYFAGALVGPVQGPPTPESCTCTSCVSPLDVNFSIWPSFNYSGENHIQLLVSGQMCFTSMTLLLEYEIVDLNAASLTPQCTPFSGGVNMTVVWASASKRGITKASSSRSTSTALGFPSMPRTTITPNIITDAEYFCLWANGFSTPAKYNETEDSMVCPTPPIIAVLNTTSNTSVSFHLSLRITLEFMFYSPPLDVYYYLFPRYISVHPPAIDCDQDDETLIVSAETPSFLFGCQSYFKCKIEDLIVNASFVNMSSIACPLSLSQLSRFKTFQNVNVSITQDDQWWTENFTVQIINDESDPKGKSFGLLRWVIIGGGIFFVICVAVILVIRKKRQREKRSAFFGPFDKKLSLQDVVMLESIGKGSFGQVYRAVWEGTEVAVKKIHPHMVSDHKLLQDFHNEILILRSLHHQNIVQFFGAGINPPEVFLVTEYMQLGSLYLVLHSNLELRAERLFQIAIDAVKGMNYLHSSQPVTIHRDLKSHNLLIDKYWRTKVCDFGLSKIIDNAWDTLQTACGTPCWTAPEILRGETYTTKADVYSFAVVMWEMLTREDPFKNMTPFRVVLAVGTNSLRLPLPENSPLPWKELIERSWHADPNQRPDFSQILKTLQTMRNVMNLKPPTTIHPDGNDSEEEEEGELTESKSHSNGTSKNSSQNGSAGSQGRQKRSDLDHLTKPLIGKHASIN